MPGGALEVGETPAEGVARETLEETGVRVRATRLVGLFDSRFSGRATAHHIYMFLFLCEPLFDDAQPETATSTDEVVEVQWFSWCDGRKTEEYITELELLSAA
mgnify:CR=1 FL=1